eukprot:jgi/Chrzof1/6559/Cz19g01020.t1
MQLKADHVLLLLLLLLQAKQEAAKTSEETLEVLSDMTKTPTSQLKFIMDAWNQIIECRRMLKWTYAYGYYEFTDDTDAATRQRQFFEFLQGDAEKSLDQLHEVAEIKLRTMKDEYQDANIIPVEVFQDFRKRLIGLTDVTHSFFDKLVRQLEKGFSDMDRMYAGEVLPPPPGSSSTAAAAADGAGPSSRTRAAGNGNAEAGSSNARSSKRGGKRARAAGAAGGGSSSGAAAAAAGGGEDETDPITGAVLSSQGFWKCPFCTLNNANLDASECEICGLPRP